jgi:hypothetical protein
LLAACGLAVNGLETTAGDGGAGGGDATADVRSADASQEASSGGDTGVAPEGSSNDTGTTGDVVVSETGPVDGCVATGPESCTNGIDDDCNGLTDCADPACTTQGYACVTPAPNGWDNVAFDATSQAGCPATLMDKNVDVDPTMPAPPDVCGCACTPGASPSCETGNISATHGPNNQCNAGGVMNYPASGGNCNKTALAVDSFVLAAQPPAAGGTCTATATVTPTPTGATQGEVCSGEKTFGSGCTAPQVCGLVPTGFTSCVHHGGANMGCPAGYATPHSVGTVMDTRGCGACMCGTPTATCSAGIWAFFSSNDCSGAVGISLQTNDQCDGTGDPSPGPTFQSNKFSSTPVNGSVACGPAPTPPPTGTVMLTGADTICCD